jgi:hypothetical protein
MQDLVSLPAPDLFIAEGDRPRSSARAVGA